ncbi:uncharacterized protein LOC142240023 [Haematobia irritans]|uniref:uncharacterized protein LOC142240023 n=1 Tax=Haematobia irritans TaxID=7368 RepID=UPI003F4FFCA6
MGLENRTSIVLSIFAVLLVLASSSPIASDPHFHNSLEVFNSNLFSEIYKEYGSKNLIFSPFSIQTCVTMASVGAAGKTATDMEQSLGFAGQSSESVAENFHSILTKYANSKILQMANKFYIMDGFKVKDHFNEVLTNKFFSSAENINFGDSDKATDIINNWVKSKTDNAIEDLIKPNVISRDTRMLLLSAIHFKGMWKKPFSTENTKDMDFYTSETTTVKVPMMYKGGRASYGWYRDLEASAVRLPYADSDLSMLIVLPNSRTGLAAMMKKMKTIPLDSLTKNMITSSRSVDIYLPKFKAELDIKLNEILKKMGMESMFYGADFSNMLDSSEHIEIGKVLHKAVIEVNEEGTKAAAGTAMEAVSYSSAELFNANHPFYYVIINEDSVPLFEDRTSFVLSIFAVLLALTSSSPIASDPHFHNSLEVFNSNLFSEIYKEYGSKNLIFSPFSIQTCVTMASVGAAGKTATDMEQGLGFAGQSSESVAENFHSILNKYVNSNILQMANKFYIMDGYKVKDHFNEVLTNKFFSSAENINFRDSDKATDIINNWVKSKTDNAIEDLIKPNVINGDTRMFLLSAIHFQGMWKKPFSRENTKELDFYTSESTTVKVPMMYKRGRASYGWYQDLEASAVRLPYADSDLSMLIVLPDSLTGLAALMQKMKTIPLDSLTKNMRTTSRSVHIYLPKFKAELDIQLNEVLEKMGMKSMFHDADFSNMLDSPEHIAVGKVLHKAVIEVNEEGTKAAAGTALEAVAYSSPTIFNANHPFYYAIINEDSVPLFEGTYVGV